MWNLRITVDRAFDRQSKGPGLDTQRRGSVLFFIIFNFIANFFLLNFHPNEADKRSLLFTLPFPRIVEWYFHHNKSYMGEKNNIDYLVTCPT